MPNGAQFSSVVSFFRACIVLNALATAHAVDVFVSVNGTDNQDCGLAAPSACLTLGRGVVVAQQHAADTIRISAGVFATDCSPAGIFIDMASRGYVLRAILGAADSLTGEPSTVFDCASNGRLLHVSNIGAASQTQDNNASGGGFTIANLRVINGNIADPVHGGGAILVSCSQASTTTTCSLALLNCGFHNNTALFLGGAVQVVVPTSVTQEGVIVDRCVFSQNQNNALYVQVMMQVPEEEEVKAVITPTIKITSCKFLNNTNHIGQGGAVTIIMDSSWTFNSTTTNKIDIDANSNDHITTTTTNSSSANDAFNFRTRSSFDGVFNWSVDMSNSVMVGNYNDFTCDVANNQPLMDLLAYTISINTNMISGGAAQIILPFPCIHCVFSFTNITADSNTNSLDLHALERCLSKSDFNPVSQWTTNGGAIAVTSQSIFDQTHFFSVSILNSLFVNNINRGGIEARGGAVWIEYGEITQSDLSTTVEYSRFENNWNFNNKNLNYTNVALTASTGGAVGVRYGGSVLSTGTNTRFSHNIFISNGNSNALNCFGGAVSILAVTFKLSNAVFLNNTFLDNQNTRSVAESGSPVETWVTLPRFSTSSFGGAVSVYIDAGSNHAPGIVSSSSIHFLNQYVIGNSNVNNGYPLFNQHIGGGISLTLNSAISDIDLQIHNCTFDSNWNINVNNTLADVACNVRPDLCTSTVFNYNYGGGLGLYLNSTVNFSSISIDGSLFLNNSNSNINTGKNVANFGGAASLMFHSLSAAVLGSTVSIGSNKFQRNRNTNANNLQIYYYTYSNNFGGGFSLYSYSTLQNLTFEAQDCDFSQETNMNMGNLGALNYNYGAALSVFGPRTTTMDSTITLSNLVTNDCTNENTNNNKESWSFGGSLSLSLLSSLNSNNILTITQCNLSRCSNVCNSDDGMAFNNGGGLSVDLSSVLQGHISLTNTTITDSVNPLMTILSSACALSGTGGGFYLAAQALVNTSVLVENNYFASNIALLGGGGCMSLQHLDESNFTLSTNHFTHNEAHSSGGALKIASAAVMGTHYHSQLISTFNVFKHNVATDEGGACSLDSGLVATPTGSWGHGVNISVYRTIFKNNTAARGSGLSVDKQFGCDAGGGGWSLSDVGPVDASTGGFDSDSLRQQSNLRESEPSQQQPAERHLARKHMNTTNNAMTRTLTGGTGLPILFVECDLEDNTATSTGTLFFECASAVLLDCAFVENSAAASSSQVWINNGGLFLNNISVAIDESDPLIAQFSVSGGPLTFDDPSTALTMDCEEGFVHIQQIKNRTSLTCEECPTGEYILTECSGHKLGDNNCHECPEGAACLGGNEIVSEEGFWKCVSVDTCSVTMYECPEGFCLEDDECAENRDQSSVLCGTCMHGTTNVGEECRECDENSIVFITLAFVASTLFVLLLLYSATADTQGSKGILIYFLQILHLVLHGYHSPWLASITGFFDFQISKYLCYSVSSDQIRLFVDLATPLAYFAELLVIYLLFKAFLLINWFRKTRAQLRVTIKESDPERRPLLDSATQLDFPSDTQTEVHGRPKSDEYVVIASDRSVNSGTIVSRDVGAGHNGGDGGPSGEDGHGDAGIAHSHGGQEHDHGNHSQHGHSSEIAEIATSLYGNYKFFRTFSMLALFSFETLVEQSLQLLACMDLGSCGRVMAEHPNLPCPVDRSDTLSTVLFVCAVFIQFWAFVFPLGLWLWLWRNQKMRRTDPVFQAKYGVLYTHFHDGAFWWHTEELVRRAIIALVFVLWYNNSDTRRFAMFTVCFVSWAMQIFFRPFHHAQLNALESISLGGLTLISGLVMSPLRSNASSNVISVLVSVFAFYLTVAFVRDILTAGHSKHLKLSLANRLLRMLFAVR